MLGKCLKCDFVGKLTKDHIIPQKFFYILLKYKIVNAGEKNKEWNIQWLCEDCNRKKGHKLETKNPVAWCLKDVLFNKVKKESLYLTSVELKAIREIFNV